MNYLNEAIGFQKGRVFLGGTWNGSGWRDELISMLTTNNYFNPIVDNWYDEARQVEQREKEICQYHLYVLTPLMTGVFSIAELIDDSNKIQNRTIFCILNSDKQKDKNKKYIFDKDQMRSLKAVKEMAINNGAIYYDSLRDIADFMNGELYKSFKAHSNYIEK